MTTRSSLALVTVLSAMAPASLAAKDKDGPAVLEASSPWNVNFGQETCRLARLFGEGENRHMIFFEQWGPASQFYFSAAGPEFKRFRGGNETKWRAFDSHEAKPTKPFKGTAKPFGPALIYSNVDLEHGQEYLDRDVRKQNKKAAKASAEEQAIASLPSLDTAFATKAKFIALRQGKREVVLKTGPLDEAFKVLNDLQKRTLHDV